MESDETPPPRAAAPDEEVRPVDDEPPVMRPVELDPLAPETVRRRWRPSRRALLIAGGALAVALATGAIAAGTALSIRHEEARRWRQARAGASEAAWGGYARWADALERRHDLRAFWAPRVTPIEAHAPLAADRALEARVEDAAARSEWSTLCRTIEAHPDRPAAELARRALADRAERAAMRYRAITGQRGTPLGVASTIADAIVQRGTHRPCDEGAVVRVGYEIAGGPLDEDLDGERTVREALVAALARADRARPLGEALARELRDATGGTLPARWIAPDERSDASVEIWVTLRFEADGRLATPSGRELPGLALAVRVGVTSTRGDQAPGQARADAGRGRLPERFALELFGSGDPEPGARVRAMIERLHPDGESRAREALGLRAFGRLPSTDGRCHDVPPLVATRRVHGNTRNAPDATSGTCVDAEAFREAERAEAESLYGDHDVYELDEGPMGPERVYRLVVPERSEVAAYADADFMAALYLRDDCRGGEELACGEEANRVSATLDPGVYYLYVDAAYPHESGPFDLTTSVHGLDEVGRACRRSTSIAPGEEVTGSLSDARDVLHGSCGGIGAPERLHAIEVPTRARLRCVADGDARLAVYLRERCRERRSEQACEARASARGPTELSTTVEAGTYVVAVDAASAEEDAGRYTLRCETAPLEGGDPGVADACAAPGAIALEGGRATFEVDTFAAHDDHRASCAGEDAPDRVYRLEVPTPSHLSARWEENGFRGSLALLDTCASGASERACGFRTLDAEVEPGTYYLVADGAFSAPFGRGRVSVTLEPLAPVCRAAPILVPGAPRRATFASGGARFRGSCGGRSRGHEVLRRFSVARRSEVTIEVATTDDASVYLRRTCHRASSELACARAEHGSAALHATLDPGEYTVFVDRDSRAGRGAATLTLTTRPVAETPRRAVLSPP